MPDGGGTLDLNTCCAVTYGHPLARALLGDSLHPGGLALTSRLAALMGIGPASNVLDAGSGLGATPVHLAHSMGCRVTAVTLEHEGGIAGSDLAGQEGVDGRVRFIEGDILQADVGVGVFDSVLIECVMSIFTDKPAATRRLVRLLGPQGRIGLTDVTVSGPLPPELSGVLATAGCVGGALSMEGYLDLLEREGMVIEHAEDCREVAEGFLSGLSKRMVMVEIALGLGKLSVSEGLLSEGKRFLGMARELAASGVLGYGMIVARKPA
jgi:ubiquinone/menaquinone biosynthesis C-methylase UbiE